MLRRLGSLPAKLGRLGIFLSAVGALLYLLFGRVVDAKVDTALLGLGSGLAQLAEGSPASGPRTLLLNGTALHLDTATRAESVGAVLDGAEDGCVPAAGARGLSGEPLRGEGGGRGFVACVSRLTEAEAAALGERAVGGVSGYRYVYAQPGLERTQVVRLWSEGLLDLEAMFPPIGDAPGEDAPGVPRPPEARRLLSARELDAPQQLTVYEATGQAPGQLEAWYQARLPALGWRPLVARPAAGARVLVTERDDTLAALVFDRSDTGGATVTILTSL